MYKRLQDTASELNDLRDNGVVKGFSIGWGWDILPITIKLGTTTYIGSAPASGKSELWFEILINLSCLHGWKHLIFSPETGEAKDIFSELCYKYIGKPYVKGQYSMSESEKLVAEMFINEHFVVIDPIDEDLTIDSFYELANKIERELNITFHTTTIDPWNELTENYHPNDLGREDKYLSRILGYARKNARKTNRHNCIINHVRDQAPITKDGISYYPPPTARDFAGGQVWFRKGMLMLIPWRPPVGLLDDKGQPYANNEVHLKVAKSKPKGVSINGTYRMYLDIEKYQYYMVGEYGIKIYANRGEHNRNKEEAIQVSFNNKDIWDIRNDNNNDVPF